MSTSVAACLIWVDFVPPSVQHVPYLLPVHGVPCVRALVYRLRGFFADRCAYVLLSAAEGALADRLALEASQADALFVRTHRAGVAEAIVDWCRVSPALQAALVFPANAIIPNAHVAEDMLSAHLSGRTRAGVTIATDVPPGLAPTLALSASSAQWLADIAPRAGTCQELRAAAEASTAATTTDSTTESTPARVHRYRARDAWPVPLDTLPSTALVADEPTRLAAEGALTACATRHGWEPAQAFKRAWIRASFQPRAVRPAAPSVTPRAPHAPHAPRARRARTVLFSSLQPAFSGGEESLGTLITHLDRRHFVPVAVFPWETLLAHKLERDGVNVEIAGWDYTTLHPANLQYCTTLLDQHRPAVVHVDGFVNPALMVAARLRGIPIVGHLRILAGPGLPTAAYLADRIITVSDAVARDARQNTLDPRTIVRIYNGVERTRLALDDLDRAGLRRAHQIPEDARVIAMIARITTFKRLDLLLDALPAIVRAVPSAHVVFAGERFAPDREYHETLRAAANADGLRGRVTWWGFEPDIRRVYAVSDLLVHANRHEPLARCMIESLACGLPIVGPRDGGTVEIVDDGRNGLQYEPDSASALAEAVIAILGDETRRLTMAREALAMSAEFSAERHVEQVQSLYRELLAERRAAAASPAQVAAAEANDTVRRAIPDERGAQSW